MATDKGAIVKEFLNGKQITGTLENEDISILVNFESPLGTAVSVERVTFVLDAYETVLNHRRNIYEGLSYTYQVNNKLNTDNIDFWVDLTSDGVNNPANREYNTKIVLKDGNVSLEDNLRAIDYGYLESIGLITDQDYINVDYNVIEFDRAVKSITALIMIYVLSTALLERAKDLGKDTATGSGIAAAG